MKSQTIKDHVEIIISTVGKLISGYLDNPADRNNDGNVAICIIDDQGNVYGRMYGSNKVCSRRIYQIAWTKASQVWLTGMRTRDFEKKVFNGELNEEDFGIEAPDLIGWPGGLPVVLKDGTRLSIGFSGFSGASDIDIVQKAVAEIDK